jgi:hypothetical protein
LNGNGNFFIVEYSILRILEMKRSNYLRCGREVKAVEIIFEGRDEYFDNYVG